MTLITSAPRRLAPILIAVACLLATSQASALSRRDQAATESIQQRMAAAEARYRDALVKIGNSDPGGQKQGDAALEDMEDVVAACSKQRGCEVLGLLTTYKRLLKQAADGEAMDGDEIDPNDPDPDHIGAGHAGAGQSGTLAADVPEAARAASLLDDSTHRFDDMVQYNPAVQAGIRRWLTDMRGQLMDSYENYEYLRRTMSPSFERAGLPEALLFGIMAKESNGKVHATSRAGAAGPMQFMYATGQRFGLGKDSTGFDTRYDPHAAAEASAAYLNERMGQLNNSIEMALAAYNGGEGRALRVYQGSGGRGFWNADVYNQFPAETQDYVPMVIAAAWLFLHPRQYGLSFPRVETRPALLEIKQPTSIYALAICLGNRGERDGYMRALRNLNPRYQADSRIPAGASLKATTRIAGLYNRYCLHGPRATLAQQLVNSDPTLAIVRGGAVRNAGLDSGGVEQAVATASASAAVKPKRPHAYTVQRGETLTSIAKKFQCSTGALAKANRIKAPRYAIRPGQRLKLEGCKD